VRRWAFDRMVAGSACLRARVQINERRRSENVGADAKTQSKQKKAYRIWFRHLQRTLMTGRANGAAQGSGANLISHIPSSQISPALLSRSLNYFKVKTSCAIKLKAPQLKRKDKIYPFASGEVLYKNKNLSLFLKQRLIFRQIFRPT
jgi:hypothetical protein